MAQSPKITVYRSVEAILPLRRLWESLYASGKYTVFQSFDLNLLAAGRFAEREEPYIVSAESPNGAAIVPAVVRRNDGTIRLLGEELFDYRTFLHQGEGEVLQAALAALAELERPLEIVAMRDVDRQCVSDEWQMAPFAAAPGVSREKVSAEQFAAAHTRLARNLRRMDRMGFQLRSYDGTNPQILRSIYTAKAKQSESSLFHDPARIEFLVSAAGLMPDVFETFTLENGGTMAAAVVTLRDRGCRRFYTGWFAAEHEKHSPALALIYEITRYSLAQGLDCDYMTGEQSYKLRLATSAVPLYRVRATAERLSAQLRAAA